jgi:hypothetical protein
MQRIWNDCTNKDQITLRRSSLFAVEVEIEDESIYVIYWVLFGPQSARKRLEEHMLALSENSYVIYNHTAHSFITPINHALVHAIVHKLRPGLAALLAP